MGGWDPGGIMVRRFSISLCMAMLLAFALSGGTASAQVGGPATHCDITCNPAGEVYSIVAATVDGAAGPGTVGPCPGGLCVVIDNPPTVDVAGPVADVVVLLWHTIRGLLVP